jgi:hypothetical protein
MYYAMRAYAVMLLIILTTSLAVPVMAANDDRYGYITVEQIHVQLDNGSAVIHVDYKVEENTRFIFFLLGKQDLKNKLMKILNYQDARINRIDLSSADFTVENASLSYGNGIYWYPAHTFNIAVPMLSVKSPQAVKNFTMTREFPGGMGYFAMDTRLIQNEKNNASVVNDR